MASRRRPADLSDHTFEHVATRELQRVLVWFWPWPTLLLVLLTGVALRRAWPGPAGAAAVALGAAILGLLDIYLTHHRKGLARYFAAITSVAAGWWLAWVMAAGVSLHPLSPAGKAWLIGGGLLAACWSRWLHVHEAGDEAGMARPFSKAIIKARLDQGVRLIRSRRVSDGKVTATVEHAGITQEQMLKELPAIEASWPNGMPPGSIVPTRSQDNAAHTHIVIADPRTLNKPIPWPGPSIPRGSIAQPLRVGRWQDGTDALIKMINFHLQIMAMTGAGKTLGAGYSILKEMFSRRDVFVVAVDLGKQRQFLGPAEQALHYLATEPAQFRAVLDAFTGAGGARKNWLGSRNLGNWEENCGLMHGVLWIEEAAEAFLAIDADMDEVFEPLMRTLRSAGIMLVYSIHRATHDQLPTFIRDMAALCTMGVRQDSHARYGLSPQQLEADCSPELWADNPEDRGKYFLDIPTLARNYRTMAGRFYFHGSNTKSMTDYARQYPASARPMDEVTLPFFAELMGQVHQRQAATATVAARPSTTLTAARHQEDTMADDETRWAGDDDPLTDEEIAAAGDAPLGAAGPDPGPAVPPSREVALSRVRDQIHAWRVHGVPHRQGVGAPPADFFAIKDLNKLTPELGKTRQWLYTVMPDLEAEQEVRRDEENGGWRILPKAA